MKSARFLLACAIATALLGGCSREIELSVFEDATQGSGLKAYAGMTHGAAWGDFDGDGLPDVYVTNHLRDPMLFRNLGQGRFTDVTGQVFAPEEIRGDKHGAVWADFDNDGRQDLVQLTGAIKGMGAEPKRLYRNDGDRFTDIAESAGVLNPDGRTRMPLWVDIDHDGRLDLFHGAEARFDGKTPPFLFVQGDDGFAPSGILSLAARGAPFCTLTELTNDDTADLLCRIIGKNRTAQVFDLSVRPPRDLELLPPTAFEDVATADLDNDGRMDVFLARKNPPGPVAFGQPSDRTFVADVSIDEPRADKPTGFTFRSRGALDVTVSSTNPGDAVSADRIHLGAQGGHPDAMRFALEPDTPGIVGMAPHAPGSEAGVYLGFTAPDTWEVRLTAPREALAKGNPKYQQVQLRVEASAPIDELESIGEPPAAEEAPARLFMNRDGKLVEEGEQRGVNARLVAGMNVVGGRLRQRHGRGPVRAGLGGYRPAAEPAAAERRQGQVQRRARRRAAPQARCPAWAIP